MQYTRFADVVAQTRLQTRDYQLRLGQKALDMFRGQYRNGAGEIENAAKSIAIEAPTGSGKTPLGLCILKAMQVDDPELRAVWVTMRRNLLVQAEKENLPPTSINTDGKDIGANITFLSMFARTIPGHLLPHYRRQHKLIFMHDELTHDASATACHLHNELRPDHVLGLSAFPMRTDRVKLAFEKTIKDAGIHELIQAGYLSEYWHFTIPDWSPQTVAHFYLAEPDRWGPSLAFFNTLDQCREFAYLVNSGGRRCELVDASTDREQQIDDLKGGSLDILVNCAILTEGFNFPDLKTCFTRNSWQGCTVQQAGRIFRPSKLYRYKQIVQSKDTSWPFVRTATPAQSMVYRDNGWLSLKINTNINRVLDETRFEIAQAVDTIPANLREYATSKRRKRF